MKEFVLVGAGLFNCVLARQLKDAGKRVRIIEARNHIGGNCYSELRNGVEVHVYGPHVFHTSDQQVWDYMGKFGTFNRFTYRPQVRSGNETYSFPINMVTFQQLWGIDRPRVAKEQMSREMDPFRNLRGNDFESFALRNIGSRLYHQFYYGYTRKMWGIEPSKLPSSIMKRIPVRFTWNNDYFDDTYEGVPIAGWGNLFKDMIADIKVDLNCKATKDVVSSGKHLVVWTGGIDSFLKFKHDPLPYRSLEIEWKSFDYLDDANGCAAIHFPDLDNPNTRVIEHRHFGHITNAGGRGTVLTTETPCSGTGVASPYYPMRDIGNANKLYAKYVASAKRIKGVIFAGRLGSYRYQNMDAVVRDALDLAKRLI